MGYRAVTKKVNRKTLPQGHKPIDGFNAALDAAVKEYGSQFPTIGDRGDVRVELSATVQRDNPGAYDDYIVTLSPI